MGLPDVTNYTQAEVLFRMNDDKSQEQKKRLSLELTNSLFREESLWNGELGIAPDLQVCSFFAIFHFTEIRGRYIIKFIICESSENDYNVK